MSKLYEITNELVKFRDAESEEDFALAKSSLDALQIAFEHKVENICKLIKEKEEDERGLQLEISRLISRKQAASKASEWLRSYLKTNMEAAGIPKVKTVLFGVSLSDSKPKVVVKDLAHVPPEFIRVEVIKTPNKEAISEHFKTTGEIPDGCDIEVGKTLRIS